MDPGLEFHPLTPADVPAWWPLVRALYEEDPPGREPGEDKARRTLEHFAREPHAGSVQGFHDRDTLVGYAILVHFWSQEYGGRILVIDELYVAPEHRGRGIGTRFLEDAAAGRFGETVGLALEVTPSNPRALAWYRRMGFVESPNIGLLRAPIR